MKNYNLEIRHIQEKLKKRDIIKSHKPWLKSSGPKTQEGRDNMRYNALKHGHFSAPAVEFYGLLEAYREFLRNYKKL